MQHCCLPSLPPADGALNSAWWVDRGLQSQPCLFLPPFSPEQGTLGKAWERLALGSLLCALSLTVVDFYEEGLIMFCTACLTLRFSHNAASYLCPTPHLSLKWFSEWSRSRCFFWNSLAFSIIQRMLTIWSLVPLPFLNPAWTSGSSWFMYYWSLAWRILSMTLLAREMSAIVRWFEHSLALPFFGTGMKTDLFQSCGHCCFPNLLAYWVQHFHSIIF